LALVLGVGLPSVSAAQTPPRSHTAHHKAPPKPTKLPKKPAHHATAPKKRTPKPHPQQPTATKQSTRHKHHTAPPPTTRHSTRHHPAVAGANPAHKSGVSSVYNPPPDLKPATNDAIKHPQESPLADGAKSPPLEGDNSAPKLPTAEGATHAPDVPTVAHPKAPTEPTSPEVPAPKGYDTPSDAIPTK